MFMFLPFAAALAAACGALLGRRAPAYVFWLAALVVILAWFKHHATSPLGLSF